MNLIIVKKKIRIIKNVIKHLYRICCKMEGLLTIHLFMVYVMIGLASLTPAVKVSCFRLAFHISVVI